MSGARVAEAFVDDGTDGPTPLGVYGAAIGVALGLSGLMLALATLFAIGDELSLIHI